MLAQVLGEEIALDVVRSKPSMLLGQKTLALLRHQTQLMRQNLLPDLLPSEDEEEEDDDEDDAELAELLQFRDDIEATPATTKRRYGVREIVPDRD